MNKFSSIEIAEKEFEECLVQTNNLELFNKYITFKTLMALKLDKISEILDNTNKKAQNYKTLLPNIIEECR